MFHLSLALVRTGTRITLCSLGMFLALAAARPATAMPPPAPGNTKGLPESVREMLRENPDLFYPRTGFKPVIERQKLRRREIVREMMGRGMTAQDAQTASLSRVTTTRYCPVLCGIYADKASPDWPVGDLVDELFSLEYGATNPLGHPGSMREHYLDMSYGTFNLEGGVFGWFALPDTGGFYYSDDNGLGVTRPSGEAGAFIRHTLQGADPTVDFRPYDNDGPDNIPNSGDDDGVADLVMFVHPNEGGECGGTDIWSHSFSYSGWAQHGAPFVTDDIGFNGQPIKVDDYVIMPAISCFGGRIEIGVFSHEFGHALGLPDLYDRTAYDPAGAVSTGGMGLFCLMAAGSYGGDYAHPETPVQMCAWSKEELGFLAPREIICDETSALYYQGDAAEALKLWAGGDYSRNEWFLVENRQRKKWDQYLLGTGFLITHIDNNVLTQNDEACPGGNPCPSHYQVMVVEADGQWEMQAAAAPVLGPWFGESEDFFSAENNDTWNDLSNPSSRDHSGASTGVSVLNIGPSGEKMFADFSVSQVCANVPDLSIVSSRISGGCDLDGFLDAGETVSLAVTLRNFPTAAPASAITGTLTSLSPAVSVVAGTASFPALGRGKFGAAIVPFQIQASAAALCSTQATLQLQIAAEGGYQVTRNFTVQVGLDSLFVPMASFADDVESGNENGWRHYAYINEDDWAHNTNANHTTGAIPGHSWFTASPATGKDVSLEPPAFVPSAGSVVSFWHKYDTEDNWDGCVMELSTDGGHTWVDVGDDTNVGYPDSVTVNPQSPISGRRCWNGLNASYPLFDQVTLDMSPYAGQTCILRYRLASDLAATGLVTPGWNIDDYQVTNAAVLRERCEATTLCGGVESDPPVFGGLDSAVNPNAAGCDVVDLEWLAATDASDPVTYLVYVSETAPVPTVTPAASTTALRYRVEGLTIGRTYRFLVRARDSQGNVDQNVIQKTVTMACDPPDFSIMSYRLTETASCDADQRPDGGETLTLQVTLRNTSGSHARNVRASLRSLSDRVGVLSGEASYGDLNSQHFEEGGQPFEILIGDMTTCMTSATLALDIFSDWGSTTRTIDLLLESDLGFQALEFTDDMEGVEPNGWSHSAESGADDWGYVTSSAHSATHAWFHPDTPGITNASLVTPALYVSSTSVLSFWHRYVLESGFDGGVLEISIDGGATWEDIGPTYDSSQNPLGPAFGSPFAPGTPFWSGDSGGFVQVTVNLGAMTTPLGAPRFAGQTALIRWRIGCDDSNTEPPHDGWWIDDVSLTDTGSFTTLCDACQPVLDAREITPTVSLLAQNHPNPVRSAGTRIAFQVAEADRGPVRLLVFDLSGRLVRTLLDEPRDAGVYDVSWDGADDGGRTLAGGIYFYELRVGPQRFVKKMMLTN